MHKKSVLIKFGDNLRLERLRRRLSQEDLAEMAGLSTPNHIGKIERAEVNPTLTTIATLLKVLDIDFETLYDPKI